MRFFYKKLCRSSFTPSFFLRGRTILLFAIFLVLVQVLPYQAFSQTGSPCNEWAIEVCEMPLDINTDLYDNPGCTDDCNRVYYYFYLVKVGSQGDLQTEQPFAFTSLSLTGTLAVTPGSISGQGLSDVNIKRSKVCTTNFPGINNPGAANSPVLSYDLQSNVFAYEASSNNPAQPVLNWSVYGRLLLFVLAVDVFPNEYVEPTGMSYSFELFNSGNPVICTGAPQVCSNPPNLTKTIAQPTTSCTSSLGTPVFLIGAAQNAAAPGFPNRKKMPVWVYAPTSMNFSWDEVDFLMSVTSIQGMLMPKIEGGKIIADAVKVYPLGSGYRIYAHQVGNVQIQNGASTPNSGNILFYIVFDGPLLESECSEATVDFTGHARLDGGDFTCCKPNLGTANTVSWGSVNCVTAKCPELTLKALKNATTSSNFCGSVVYFDLYVNSTQTVNLTDVRCVIEVKKTGTFSLNTLQTNSPYCSPSVCIAVTDISADYLRVEYTAANLNNLSLFQGVPVLLTTIALTTTDNGCIAGMTFLDAVVFKSGASTACLTYWYSDFSNAITTDDICAVGQQFEVSAETVSGNPIPDWSYYINQFDPSYNNPTCEQTGATPPGGSTISRCVCILQNAQQNVVLKKNDNPLNGVSTYDLVLISKHILGLQQLSPGFNILAADANMSNSVTTFDIVEIRKLILGIYSSFPDANSWRFIDKDLKNNIHSSSTPFSGIGDIKEYDDIAPNPPNLFADEEFDEFALPPITNLDSKAEFVGFKVGDVNNSSIPGFNQPQTDDRSAGVLVIGTRAVEGRTGESVEIPVFTLTQQSLTGWQMALGYDTNEFKVNGIRWPADIPRGAMQDRGWHLAKPGELRILWFDGEGASTLKPGTPLFFVQAELRSKFRSARQLLQLAGNSIPQEAYDDNLQQYSLHLESSEAPLLPVALKTGTTAAPTFRLAAYPNPAGAHFRLEIEASVPATAYLDIRDIMGREIVTRPLDLTAGMNTVNAAQLPALISGQYFVSLYTPTTGVETLRLVKH